MHTQIKKQSVAFNRGFKSIIKQHWMGMFSGPELQRLISGDECDLDITDMRNNTIYYGGYHNQHKVGLSLSVTQLTSRNLLKIKL